MTCGFSSLFPAFLRYRCPPPARTPVYRCRPTQAAFLFLAAGQELGWCRSAASTGPLKPSHSWSPPAAQKLCLSGAKSCMVPHKSRSADRQARRCAHRHTGCLSGCSNRPPPPHMTAGKGETRPAHKTLVEVSLGPELGLATPGAPKNYLCCQNR